MTKRALFHWAFATGAAVRDCERRDERRCALATPLVYDRYRQVFEGLYVSHNGPRP